MRTRLLTCELIGLSEKFTQFVAEMNSFVLDVAMLICIEMIGWPISVK